MPFTVPEIEDAVVTLLSRDSGVAALLKADGHLRVYPGKARQKAAYPLAVYNQIATVGSYTLRGPVSLVQTRIQFDFYGKTNEQTAAAAKAVRKALSGFKGSVACVDIAGVFLVMRQSRYEDAGELKVHRRIHDYIVHHHEEV